MITLQLTPEEFQAKIAELKQKFGITAPVSSLGTISHEGATVQYSYAGSTLTAEVIKKPFFISQAAAEEKLKDWLTQ